jgi:hypothetical protein
MATKALRPTKGPRWAHSQPWSKSRGHSITYRGDHGEHELTPTDPRLAERVMLQRVAMERLSQ